MSRLKIFIDKNAAFFAAWLICFAMCFSFFWNISGAKICSADAMESGQETRVIGYLPNWSYGAYKNLDFTALTHINIAFCNPNSNGKIQCGIPDSELKAIVEKAHKNNVKVMAALGGGGYDAPYRDIVTSLDKIHALDAEIVKFCENFGLDGVDLDIEIASSNKFWQTYGTWVTELRAICDERGWQLSTATAQWVAGATSTETFNKFDFLNVMAYDNDSRESNSHSSYEFAVECLNYFHTVKGVPQEKLVLGVPFYGRGYDSGGSLDWDSYKSFSELVAISAANFNSDFYSDDSGEYNAVAYTGAVTMRKKCALAKDYGGIMIWELSQDAAGEYSLLGVIKEELFSPAAGLPGELPEDTDADGGKDFPPTAELPEDTDAAGGKDFTPWIIISVVIVIVVVVVAVAAVIAAVVLKRKK